MSLSFGLNHCIVVQAELTQDIKSEAGTTVTQLCIVCNYIYIESQKLLNHI